VGLLRQTSIFARARLPALKVASQDRSAMFCPPEGLEYLARGQSVGCPGEAIDSQNELGKSPRSADVFSVTIVPY
jgi:hypothetical protein